MQFTCDGFIKLEKGYWFKVYLGYPTESLPALFSIQTKLRIRFNLLQNILFKKTTENIGLKNIFRDNMFSPYWIAEIDKA